MKKSLMASMSALVVASALSAEENRTMFVHHKGVIDAFLYAEIDSIMYSDGELGGNESAIQEIWTYGKAHRYLLSEIDSVTFQRPPTIAKDGVIDLSAKHAPYIIGAEYSNGMSLIISKDIPSAFRPKVGDILYQSDPTEALPFGFIGRVTKISVTETNFAIECENIQLEEAFEQIAWTGEGVLTNNARSYEPENKPWFVSKLKYPDYFEGVLIMNDELKDIPAGPEKAQIEAEIGIQPFITCTAGAYILRNNSGATINQRKLYTKVNSNVKMSVAGRQICEEKHTIGKDQKYTFTIPIGLGKSVSGTYVGTMSLKGAMGLEYGCRKGYISKMTTTVNYTSEGYAKIETKGSQNAKKIPEETLSASFDGELSLTGSLSLTLAQYNDSIKSITNTLTYGTALKGNALFKTSELAKVTNDTALYCRLTRTGVQAIPVEKLSALAKYEKTTIKDNVTLASPMVNSYYVVPKFSNPIYNETDGLVTYQIEGLPMYFSHSSMGVALTDGKNIVSDKIWPDNSPKSFTTAYNEAENGLGVLHPTATLPGGKRLIAAPECDIRFIDLGLSVLWAKCNVGARLPQETGDYYAWGETQTKSDYDDYNWRMHKVETDSNSNLTAEYDAASTAWGAQCRMATKKEFSELVSKCKFSLKSKNGFPGFQLTGPNGNSIFLPFAGQKVGTEDASGFGYECGYPSATKAQSSDGGRGHYYYYLYIVYDDYFTEEYGSPIVHDLNPTDLYYGQPIRAVKEKVDLK